MIEDCKYFKVNGETLDFVTIRLNVNADFGGRELRTLYGQGMADFVQFLLYEYGLATVGHAGSAFLCRKELN